MSSRENINESGLVNMVLFQEAKINQKTGGKNKKKEKKKAPDIPETDKLNPFFNDDDDGIGARIAEELKKQEVHHFTFTFTSDSLAGIEKTANAANAVRRFWRSK